MICTGALRMIRRRISIQSGWKVTATVFWCFVFVTLITHEAKNWYKLSLCRVRLQNFAHGVAIKHAGTCWNDTFHWQSFRRSLHLCLVAVDRRAIYIQPLVFCAWTVCTLIIQEPGEGGNLRLAPPLPVPPSTLSSKRRRVTLLKICFYVCDRLYFPISFGYCPEYVHIRLQNRQNPPKTG